MKKSSSDITISAKVLLNDYRSDEQLANKKYVDQIVQVEGEIAEISVENGNSIIVLKEMGETSSVLCHMLPEESLRTLKLKKGSKIAIKGMCTGYLMDVILVRCVLVNT